ncbi:unnamed protein product, partial [marine sediment metagenome]
TIRAVNAALLDDLGETVFAILRNLVVGSPVGNPSLWQNPASAPPGYVGGHFRRNWIVSIGGFNETEVEGVDNVGAATLAAGKATIEAWEKARRINTNIIIQNNVPYANRLALGWSRQASAGWVDKQIDAALPEPGGTKVVR